MPKTRLQLLLQKFKILFIEKLTSIYGKEESLHFFFMLCESQLGFTRVDVSLNFDFVLSSEQLFFFQSSLERLQKQEPIQHIIGTSYFYGNTFVVTPNTLIPRPETEELVDWIIQDTSNRKASILDIGTGSGCIAISLAKKLSNCNISAIDFSKKALQIARKNAILNNVNIDFEEADILVIDDLENNYDIIVSNPPYVRELEKKEMQSNVLDYEPETALFVSDTDPLIFYRSIAQLIVNSYTNNCKKRILYYEINEFLADETSEMLQKLGFSSIEIKRDFRGKPRMLKALWV